MRPLRFGIATIQDLPWSTLVENWKRIEALGYDSVWVADHFVNSHNIEDEWFDGWSLLAALATQTSTIRIGTLVTNIIYRNPAVIARQAQTVDHISQGRLELGIGATSARDPSHGMTGIEIWSTSERLQRFRETVEIVDKMLRQDATTYEGRYYRVKDGRMRPACLQKPRPPLTIAAHTPGSLKIAARYADAWNSYAAFGASAEDALALTRQRGEMLDRYCQEAGRDPQTISRSLLVGLTNETPFASLNAFHDFVGRWREVGISEFIFFYDYPTIVSDKCMDHAMLERIATQAIPALRSEGAQSGSRIAEANIGG